MHTAVIESISSIPKPVIDVIVRYESLNVLYTEMSITFLSFIDTQYSPQLSNFKVLCVVACKISSLDVNIFVFAWFPNLWDSKLYLLKTV